MLVAVGLMGCQGTRSSGCDTLGAAGDVNASMKPAQSTSKWDALTGAALADSDGDAIQSNQRVAVDVQAPNQSTGPQIQIAPLVGDAKEAARILQFVGPAEQAVMDRLAANEAALIVINMRLATDPALTDAERFSLEAKATVYTEAFDPLLAKLDVYAKQKFDAAAAFVPDLSALSEITYQIITNTNAGSTAPNISDHAATAIAKVAEAAVTTSQTSEAADAAVVQGEAATEEEPTDG
jgi:hypothetical protein